MNGREKISFAVLAMILSGIVAYFSGQISVAQNIASRPTRQEMKEELKATQEETQRQLDDIKRQQDRTYNEIQKINENINKMVYELRQRR